LTSVGRALYAGRSRPRCGRLQDGASAVKIAYVVGPFPSPSEQFIRREVEALREQGAEVVVYPIVCEEGFVCPWCVLGKHVWLSCLPRTWRAVAAFPFGELAALRVRAWKEFVGGLDRASVYARDMRAKGIERVHAHFATKPAAVGMMIAAMLRLPFTFSAHARDVFADGAALKHKVAAAERVVVCSRAALDDLASKVPAHLHDRLVLIRHGIDAAGYEFSPVRRPHSPPRLLAAARFVEKKGLSFLVEAVAELDDCTCEIAGRGPLEAKLREQIGRLGLEGRVTLPGWLSPEALRAKMVDSDVLVVPSSVARDGDRDGVPNVLLEAAAVGLPVVACDAGGVGEFVIEGETGRLVPADDPGAIAEAVRAALDERETTRRLAVNARKKVENEYNLRENAKFLMDLFIRPGRDRA